MEQQYISIALTMDDSSLAIMSFVTLGRSVKLPFGAIPIANLPGFWTRKPTKEAIQAEIDRAFPGVSLEGHKLLKCLSWRILREEDIPEDRAYRNAWTDEGKGSIKHNMEYAKDLHRHFIRSERHSKLIELDGKWMRAVGKGNKTEELEIEKERQKWRDAPTNPKIEQAKTIEELKQISI